MAKSPVFARIKMQVLDIVATIPETRVSTYQSIGEHLDVMPRHVASILSQLPPNEKMVYPWQRVVSGDGSLGVVKKGPDGKVKPSCCETKVFLSAKTVWPQVWRSFLFQLKNFRAASQSKADQPKSQFQAGGPGRPARSEA
jgi:alkylated DNA nucleotide flippase Atl1